MKKASSKISVIIPLYRDAEELDNSLNALINGKKHTEIIVVADQPSKETIEILSKYNGRITTIINRERKGKVNALNKAINRAKGDLLIFLDNDVYPADDDFIEKIAEKMKNADIGEVLKEIIITDSFISKMVYYDYISFNFSSYLFSRFLKKCIGFNGAAVAIWREALEKIGGFHPTVSEDLDLGLKSFIKGLRYTFITETRVYNRAPQDFKEWFSQRKRWAIGAAIWVRDNWKTLLEILVKNPKVMLPSVFMIFPSLIVFITFLTAYNHSLEKIALLTLLTLSSKVGFFLPITLLTAYGFFYFIFNNLIITILNLIIFSILYYFASKKLRLQFKLRHFITFYLLYNPLWLLIILGGLIRVLVLRKENVHDWVVSKGI